MEKRTTYTGKTKVAQRTDACAWIEQKVRRLDIAVNNASRVYVPQRTKHAPKISFRSFHGYKTMVILLKDENFDAQAQNELFSPENPHSDCKA